MHNELGALFDGSTRKNTTLIELSKQHYNKLKQYCIHVSDVRVSEDGRFIYYNSVQYGKNISLRQLDRKTKGQKKNRYINLLKSKGGYMFITGNKAECLSIAPNTHCFTPTPTENLTSSLSGIVILQMAVVDQNNTYRSNFSYWDNNVYKVAKKSKPNTLKSFDHHGSRGFNFSFGNKPLYGMCDGSSVGVYQNKKSTSKVPKRQCDIDMNANWIQMLCSSTIKRGIFLLSNIIPEINKLLCPIVNAAYRMQSECGNDMLTPIDNEDDGFWNAFLFVDGRTENFHTEHDCAYTLITVPKQYMKTDLNLSDRPHFIFKIDEDRDLYLPLTPHLSFIYNATFLTHRQSYTPLLDDDQPRFYNISSYSNEKLFNHLRVSFNRLNSK